MARARMLIALALCAVLAASAAAGTQVERGELEVTVLSKDTKKDRRAPAKLKLLATLTPPEGVDASACAQGGTVKFIVAKGLKRLASGSTTLAADCTATRTLTLSKSARRAAKLTVSASYAGNAALASTVSAPVTFKAK